MIQNLESLLQILNQTGQNEDTAAQVIFALRELEPQIMKEPIGIKIMKRCQELIKGTHWEEALYPKPLERKQIESQKRLKKLFPEIYDEENPRIPYKEIRPYFVHVNNSLNKILEEQFLK